MGFKLNLTAIEVLNTEKHTNIYYKHESFVGYLH